MSSVAFRSAAIASSLAHRFNADHVRESRRDRAREFCPASRAGVVQAFRSDWGVSKPLPAGNTCRWWSPGRRISVEAALRHFTRFAAYASFDERVRGTLTPAKLAGFVVLPKDILTSPPAEILTTKLLLTVMGGKDQKRRLFVTRGRGITRQAWHAVAKGYGVRLHS
jgi:predicted amidohydrolase YtcJ